MDYFVFSAATKLKGPAKRIQFGGWPMTNVLDPWRQIVFCSDCRRVGTNWSRFPCPRLLLLLLLMPELPNSLYPPLVTANWCPVGINRIWSIPSYPSISSTATAGAGHLSRNWTKSHLNRNLHWLHNVRNNVWIWKSKLPEKLYF